MIARDRHGAHGESQPHPWNCLNPNGTQQNTTPALPLETRRSYACKTHTGHNASGGGLGGSHPRRRICRDKLDQPRQLLLRMRPTPPRWSNGGRLCDIRITTGHTAWRNIIEHVDVSNEARRNASVYETPIFASLQPACRQQLLRHPLRGITPYGRGLGMIPPPASASNPLAAVGATRSPSDRPAAIATWHTQCRHLHLRLCASSGSARSGAA